MVGWMLFFLDLPTHCSGRMMSHYVIFFCPGAAAVQMQRRSAFYQHKPPSIPTTQTQNKAFPLTLRDCFFFFFPLQLVKVTLELSRRVPRVPARCSGPNAADGLVVSSAAAAPRAEYTVVCSRGDGAPLVLGEVLILPIHFSSVTV